jgi:hypothetical protein
MIRADRTLKVDELLFLQLHVWPVIGGGKDLQTGRSCVSRSEGEWQTPPGG